MNGLSKDLDLSFLLGKEVIQISCGVNDNIINFYGDTSITLECAFRITTLSGDEDQAWASWPDAAKLLKILGSQVTGVTNKGDGNLMMIFFNGTVLTIFDSNSDYESYQISHPAHTIVV